jgi:hypothetical protein
MFRPTVSYDSQLVQCDSSNLSVVLREPAFCYTRVVCSKQNTGEDLNT